jgi:Right handed beta helix region
MVSHLPRSGAPRHVSGRHRRVTQRTRSSVGRILSILAVLAVTVIASGPLEATAGTRSQAAAMSQAPAAVPTGCSVVPSVCGYPDASSTGVPSSVVLRRSGSVQASVDGQVISGLDITGEINVTARNVTIRDTRVTGSGDWVVIVRPGADHLVIEDSELQTPAGTPQDIACVLNIGDALPTVVRVNIHGCSAGVSSGGGVVRDSYIHDMAQRPGLSHDVGVASNGTGGMRVIHNTIFNQLQQTAAVAFYQDFDVQRNNVVRNNLLGGGGYCIYGGTGTRGSTANIRILHNRFSRRYAATCGHYGYVADFNLHDPGNAWSGNYWDDTLAPLPA